MQADSFIILVQCMTGDTPVMLPDGSEKPLALIRPGDMVASYDHGHLSAARVLNHKSQGADDIFAIRTNSGNFVRANARHPFLVEEDGVLGWRQTATLKKGARILKVTGASGAGKLAASPVATPPQRSRASATRTTTNDAGLTAFAHLLSTQPAVARRIFDTATELTLRSMSGFSQSRAGGAGYAELPLPSWLVPAIGAEVSALITAMMADMSVGFSATPATLLSATGAPLRSYGPPLPTLSVTLDEVESVTPAGREEVFDVQIENTENFIAGGLVSHNTRWHEDDLVGRITDPRNPFYDPAEHASWTVIDLPAIASDNDAMGRQPGEALWPERFPLDFLEKQRRLDPRGFQALYQGKPSADTGTFFTADMIRTYQPDELPKNLRYYVASDHAVSSKQNRDKTCLIPVGVDENENVYVLDDVWWRAAETDTVVEAMLFLMDRHKPLYWWAERGHISRSIGPFLRKRMLEEKVFVSLIEVQPIADKQTRAQSIQGRMAMGKVYFPARAIWWPDARDQLMKFPNGSNDDFVDALAYIGMGLIQQLGAAVRAPRAALKPGTFGWLKQQTKATDAANRLKRDTSDW